MTIDEASCFDLLVRQLAESKQREATLALSNRDSQRLINELNHDLADLTLERDAALNALGIARNGMKTIEHCAVGSTVHFIATMALAKISDPAAALAERDRAIREECAAWLSRLPLPRLASDYRREFSLKLKPEGE